MFTPGSTAKPGWLQAALPARQGSQQTCKTGALLTPLAGPPALRVRQHLFQPLGLNLNRHGLGSKGLCWARAPLQHARRALCKGLVKAGGRQNLTTGGRV